MPDLNDRITEIIAVLEREGRLGERFRGTVSSGELRFGTHGSLSIMVRGAARGDWYDHEQQRGGGPRELIAERGGHDIDAWLRHHRLLDEQPETRVTYDYTDERGALLFQVVRFPNHQFRQRKPDGPGWSWKLGNTRRVLYRLPELIAAKRTGNGHPWRVYLCEGEKDTDRLRRDWGVVATTNPGGAGNWRDEFNACFAGGEVILLEDNDQAGRDRTQKLAPQLTRAGAIVRVIRFPELPEKADISDWLDAGGTQSVLDEIIENTDPWLLAANGLDPQPNGHDQRSWKEPAPTPWIHPLDPWAPLPLPSLHGKVIPRRRWIVDQWLPALETTGFSGAGGQGKTLVAMMLATALALGSAWFSIPLPQTRVFALLCEDRPDDVHMRQVNINRAYDCEFADLGNLLVYPRRSHVHNRLMYFDRDRIGHTTVFFDQLLKEVKGFGTQLTILDTRSDLFFGDQNDEEQARSFVRQCTDRIAEATDGSVLLLSQPSRAGREGSGESGSVQWDAAFRARWFLKAAPEEEDGSFDPFARVLTRVKSNFSARDEEIQLTWRDGIFERTDQPTLSGIDASAADRKAERVFMQLLSLFATEKLRVNNNPASRLFAPTMFAKRPEREGVKARDFERAMRAVLHQQKVRLIEPTRGSTYLEVV